MAHDNLTYEDLLRIVELIKSSEQFSEFRLKIGEIEVELRRRGGAAGGPAITPATSATDARPMSSAPAATPAAPARAPALTPDVPTWPEGSIVVRAPMVGTFYRAPEPGARPFVDIGHAVEADTIVCIIEVMKLMNSIPAGTRGVVAQVLIEDAAPVETGQPLIVLHPESASR